MGTEALHTIGVFQDLDWARRGVAALIADGFEPETLTIIAQASAAGEALIQDLLGTSAYLHTNVPAKVAPQ